MSDPLLEPHEKKHEWTVFLDMDGVCCDFVSAAVRANGGDPEKVLAEWPENTYDITQVMGIAPEKFWKAVSAVGERFWQDLDSYPWFFSLCHKTGQMADIVFLTSPSEDPRSASGKVKWLQDRYGPMFRDYIITKRKDLLANSRAILIDDFVVNVEAFQKAGGSAVLFPQPWNSDGDLPEDRAAYVLDVVAATMKTTGVQSHIKVSLLQAARMCPGCAKGEAPIFDVERGVFVHEDNVYDCDAQHVWEKVLDRC